MLANWACLMAGLFCLWGWHMTTMQITMACKKIEQRVLSSLNEATQAHVGIIDDSEMATIASYQEYGWVQRVTPKQAGWFGRQGLKNPPKAGASLVLPPRPFFRATMQAEAKHWSDYYAKALKAYGVENAGAALQATAMRAADDIKETMIRGGTKKEQFEDRSPLTMEMYANQAAGHNTDGTGNISGAKALIKTGALLNSIGYQLS